MIPLLLLTVIPLLDRIPSAPPEIAADLLIRLAESAKVPEKGRKIELLKDAWALAPQARQPFQPTFRAGLGFTDSLSGMLSMAGDRKLDTLSLQVKAIRAMRPLDPKRAREWFVEIPPPAPPPLVCADYRAYLVDDYYLLAAEMGFEEALRAVRQITAPPQAQAAILLVLNWSGGREERAQMASALASAIKIMRADSRTVIGSPNWKLPAGASRPIDRLLERLRQEESSPLPLLDAWRTFLVAHSSGTVCQEYNAAENVKHFNTRQIAGTEIAPIADEEVKPAKREGKLRDLEFWADERTAAIMKDYKELRFGGTSEMLPEEVRRSGDWEMRLRAYLNRLEKWERDKNTQEIAWFHQRCLIHNALAAIIPSGPLYDAGLQSWVAFLGSAPARRDSPAEWLHWFHYALRKKGVAAEMRRSGDPLMNLLLDAAETL